MKKKYNLKLLFAWVMIIMLSIPLTFYAQDESPSMKAWDGLLNKPGLAEWFSDIFINMGIIVDETTEEFTVHHKGDHFTLTKGIDKLNVDYVITIRLENIQNMVKHGTDDKISIEEAYRILSVMFTPLTVASLKNPMMSKPLMRKLSGIENFIQVNLVSPDKLKITSHTLIYLNKQWIVIPGIHGQARRVFNISPEEALEYQKHFFRALTGYTGKDWRKFRKWYLEWRKGVSVRN